jgi:hypothetical protein
VGVAREIGNKQAVRVDYVYRDYRDFYGDFRDTTTGRVADSTGRQFDLVVVDNTNTIDRSYKGLSTQVSYRPSRDLQVGGNYTLSWARGNFEGEDSGSGPVRAIADDFPEYRQESWNYPVGYTNGDQRHKVRGWFNYAAPARGPWPRGRRYPATVRLSTGTTTRSRSTQHLRDQSRVPDAADLGHLLSDGPRRTAA